ncbi:ABC transporter ATP-binding protein [Nitratireductor soli]|uniref:ABC transporter ATP-binding protein n=1 Tax=Nitratireductor soli TaxID=1670619 RepID=UPI00065E32F8|nr:ABC transporter ATP-binding protein [Nitratireductor soli]
MELLLEVRGLRISIPTDGGVLHPVRGVDLSVGRGETLAVVGESGCGKSLTAQAILGLLPRNARLEAERIAFDGMSLLGLGNRQWRQIRGRRIAMIFQDPMTAFDPCYRMGDQIAEIVRWHRPRNATPARMTEMLAKVGISAPDERLGQYPHQLSGGLRQRMMIATALLCEPDLIIADEPTTALDVTIQAQILRLLADLQAETAVGLMLITHDLGVVAGIADRIAVMYGGEVVETGSKAAILDDPRHPYTKGLLDCIPTPGETGRRSALGFIPGVVPRPLGALTACNFRDRCARAMPACHRGTVPLMPMEDGRLVRCRLYDPPGAVPVREPQKTLRNAEGVA